MDSINDSNNAKSPNVGVGVGDSASIVGTAGFDLVLFMVTPSTMAKMMVITKKYTCTCPKE
jgi:hypothetical protein